MPSESERKESEWARNRERECVWESEDKLRDKPKFGTETPFCFWKSWHNDGEIMDVGSVCCVTICWWHIFEADFVAECGMYWFISCLPNATIFRFGFAFESVIELLAEPPPDCMGVDVFGTDERGKLL